jgi:NADPH:quinone reductase
MLFDRFQISETDVGSILIIGGAGGVGSIAIQLHKMSGLTLFIPMELMTLRNAVRSLQIGKRMR